MPFEYTESNTVTFILLFWQKVVEPRYCTYSPRPLFRPPKWTPPWECSLDVMGWTPGRQMMSPGAPRRQQKPCPWEHDSCPTSSFWGLSVTFSGNELEVPENPLDRLREVGTKHAKGRGVRMGLGRGGEERERSDVEISQVPWNTAPPIVLLGISRGGSQTVRWFWVRSFASQHRRMRSWPGPGNDSLLPCFPSPLFKEVDIRYRSEKNHCVARTEPGSFSPAFSVRRAVFDSLEINP